MTLEVAVANALHSLGRVSPLRLDGPMGADLETGRRQKSWIRARTTAHEASANRTSVGLRPWHKSCGCQKTDIGYMREDKPYWQDLADPAAAGQLVLCAAQSSHRFRFDGSADSVSSWRRWHGSPDSTQFSERSRRRLKSASHGSAEPCENILIGFSACQLEKSFWIAHTATSTAVAHRSYLRLQFQSALDAGCRLPNCLGWDQL